MTGWSIKGEAGKALDATERAFSALNIDSARLTLASLTNDQFEWTAKTENASGSGTIVPEYLQTVEIFHDGIRRFKGHVTSPRIQMNRITVTVEGPWWWMEKISLTSDIPDAAGTNAARPTYVFPTQELTVSITAMIDRAIALGVPMTRGSIATMFAFPRISLSEASCAAALVELMSIVPDAVAYFDYTGATPQLNIARRASMAATTYTIGTDPVEDLDLSPRVDLEVKRVDLSYVTRRAGDGAVLWASQGSGTATTGKNQIVVVSGEAINPILPKDKFDQFSCQTFAMPTGGVALSTITSATPHSATSVTGTAKSFVLANDENLATMIREFGTSFSNYLFLSNGGVFKISAYYTGSDSSFTAHNMDRPNLICKKSTAGMYVVSAADKVPEWATFENGYAVHDATMTGWVRYLRFPLTANPSWWWAAVERASAADVGYPINENWPGGGGDTSSAGNFQYNLFFEFAIPVQLISSSFSSLTTVYRQWDYDYITPPAGLAAALVAAQNWTPYDGTIQLVGDSVDGAPLLNQKYNVAGALAAHASMGALPKSAVYDIFPGRKTIYLGPPARTDFGTLAARFRRNKADNIVYL